MRVSTLAIGLLALGLLTACASPAAMSPSAAGASPSAPMATASAAATATASSPVAPSAAPASVTLAATATQPSIDVFDAPGGAVVSTLTNPQESGAPLTFLVAHKQGDWLQVDLPLRPNGSTGWVRASSESLSTLEYRLSVSTESNTLSVYRGGVLQHTYSVATGTGGTPTPHGSFYLTELLAPTNSGYGPYAFGLSAFSDVLSSFGGGPGQIGLHGTDDSGSIGHAVSHGCIRLANADITTLAGELPLGTPIDIL